MSDGENEKQSNIEESASRWGQSAVAFIKKSLSIIIRIAKGAVKGVIMEMGKDTIGKNIEAHIKFDASWKSQQENKSDLSLQSRQENKSYPSLQSQQENKSYPSLQSWQENNLKAIYHKSEKYRVKDEREKEAKNLNPELGTSIIDKGKNTSDEEMQEIWAKILAGEMDNPGTFSKKTLSVLSDMNKKDAELFTSLCQFVWRDDDETPRVLIYQKDHRRENSIYQLKGINFDTLENLESMGLVRCSFGVPIAAKNLDQEHKTWHYHDIPVKIKGILTNMEIEGYCIPVGHVILTLSGRELFPISGASRNDEFFNYVIDIWQKEGHNPITQNPETK